MCDAPLYLPYPFYIYWAVSQQAKLRKKTETKIIPIYQWYSRPLFAVSHKLWKTQKKNRINYTKPKKCVGEEKKRHYWPAIWASKFLVFNFCLHFKIQKLIIYSYEKKALYYEKTFLKEKKKQRSVSNYQTLNFSIFFVVDTK